MCYDRASIEPASMPNQYSKVEDKQQTHHRTPLAGTSQKLIVNSGKRHMKKAWQGGIMSYIANHVSNHCQLKLFIRWYGYTSQEEMIEPCEHIMEHSICRYLKSAKKRRILSHKASRRRTKNHCAFYISDVKPYLMIALWMDNHSTPISTTSEPHLIPRHLVVKYQDAREPRHISSNHLGTMPFSPMQYRPPQSVGRPHCSAWSGWKSSGCNWANWISSPFVRWSQPPSSWRNSLELIKSGS